MDREKLLEQIRTAVREVETGAEIILYGSRSRGDAIAESDWDFLVLVDGPLSDGRTDRIRHRLYEVEWDSGEVISSIVRRDGLSSSKHAGIRGLFNRNYVKTGKIPKHLARIYNDLFERRQEGDYIDFVSFKESQVVPWISKAEELIRYISNLVKGQTS